MGVGRDGCCCPQTLLAGMRGKARKALVRHVADAMRASAGFAGNDSTGLSLLTEAHALPLPMIADGLTEFLSHSSVPGAEPVTFIRDAAILPTVELATASVAALQHPMSPLTQHAIACSGSAFAPALFLRIHRGDVLLLHGEKGVSWDSPYTDEYGEVDKDWVKYVIFLMFVDSKTPCYHVGCLISRLLAHIRLHLPPFSCLI